MDPSEFLQGGEVRIPEETYAVCQTDESHPAAFGIVRDETETTIVVNEEAVDEIDAEHVERSWKLLTFEMELPFELVGFLAAVATALADADISVFVLSSYSTDHVFVKEADLVDAVSQLETLGCDVTKRSES